MALEKKLIEKYRSKIGKIIANAGVYMFLGGLFSMTPVVWAVSNYSDKIDFLKRNGYTQDQIVQLSCYEDRYKKWYSAGDVMIDTMFASQLAALAGILISGASQNKRSENTLE
ncbi:MAG: hypothetical protein Q8N63_03625 [Nanoarchaeota archaeon]|nr:hypothetical protein [Nanoarchaeota archaeon]